MTQVLRDVHGDVEEGEVGDGEALALEAEKKGRGSEGIMAETMIMKTAKR